MYKATIVLSMTEATFWHAHPKPIIALAPMDGISDHPFRHIQKKYGNPALVYTEFTSVESLCHGDERRLREFVYDESQRPVIAQIFGYTPAHFYQIAILLCELGFDGIDINMGCPAKNVAQTGAGAALIKTPQLAQEIVRATQRGVRDWQQGATLDNCPRIRPHIVAEVAERHARLPAAYQIPRPIPVSVKTRIGYEYPVVDAWIPALLEVEPVAIGIHGRTLEQMYKGSADWEQIGHAAEIARTSATLILGNGDVESLDDAQTRVHTYGLDGILIGRASVGNPFVFKEPLPQDASGHLTPAALETVMSIAIEHSQLYERSFQHHPRYRFHPMRKHLNAYARRMFRARQLRIQLSQTDSACEVVDLLQPHLPSPLAEGHVPETEHVWQDQRLDQRREGNEDYRI